jgi:hypothetical protein
MHNLQKGSLYRKSKKQRKGTQVPRYSASCIITCGLVFLSHIAKSLYCCTIFEKSKASAVVSPHPWLTTPRSFVAHRKSLYLFCIFCRKTCRSSCVWPLLSLVVTLEGVLERNDGFRNVLRWFCSPPLCYHVRDVFLSHIAKSWYLIFSQG